MKVKNFYSARHVASVLTVLAASVLTACGGGGVTGDTVSGKLVDGYIRGAKMCLDLNSNNRCDGDEPSATTQSDGTWSFQAPSGTKLEDYFVIAEVPSTGAYDSDAPTVQLAGARMLAIASEAAVVSPLSTVVAGYVKAGESLESAKSKTRAALGLAADYEFTTDHVAAGDEGAHAAAKVLNVALTNTIGDAALSMDKLKLAIANSIATAKLANQTPSALASLLTQVDTATENAQPVYRTLANIDLASFNGFAGASVPFRTRYLAQYTGGAAYAGYAIYSDQYGAGLVFNQLAPISASLNGVTKVKFDLFVPQSATTFNTLHVNTNNAYYGHGNEVAVDISAGKGAWTEYEVTLDAVWADDNALTFRSGDAGWAGPIADLAVANIRMSNDNWASSTSITGDAAGWLHWSDGGSYPESFTVASNILARGNVIKGIKTTGGEAYIGMMAENFASGLEGTSVTVQLDVFSDGVARPVQVYFQASGPNGWQDTSEKVSLTPSTANQWETLRGEIAKFDPSRHTTMVVVLDPEVPAGDQVVYYSNFKVVAVVNPFE